MSNTTCDRSGVSSSGSSIFSTTTATLEEALCICFRALGQLRAVSLAAGSSLWLSPLISCRNHPAPKNILIQRVFDMCVLWVCATYVEARLCPHLLEE